MRRECYSSGEAGVSEILGVTMLLAMVVAIMSAVVVFLQPFVIDLNDNRAWAAGGVTAEQLNNRLLVVADMPNGTGLAHETGIPGGGINVLFNVESWTIGADIHGNDRVEVHRNGSGIVIQSDNRTADAVRITADDVIQGTWQLDTMPALIDERIPYTSTLQVEVLDRNGTVIHRWAEISIDGLRLSSPLSQGTFDVDLSNGAVIKNLPGDDVQIERFPRLSHRSTIDGGHTVRLVLLDVDVDPNATDLNRNLDMTSQGILNLFDENHARNFFLHFEVGGQTTVEPRYVDHWTSEHTLRIATGDLGGYSGFGPKGPLSGADGLTFHSDTETFGLEVMIQRVKVIP